MSAGEHRTTALDIVAELEEVRERLRETGLTNAERATLRLRADVLSRLLVAHEKLARLPAAVPDPDSWLQQYRTSRA